MRKKRIKIKWKNFISFLLLSISITILIISLYNIIVWYLDGKKTNDQINEINNISEITEIPSNDTEELVNPPENKEDPYWDYIKMNLIDVNFNELKAKNNETVGWIQVNGTNINYPFVQASNNEFYLTHSFNKSYNEAGWVFMDKRNNATTFDKNTIIYAHGRLDGTMFSSLKNILKSKWYDNSNNYIIKLSTEKENTLWQVFSVYRIPTTSDYIQTSFINDDDYNTFLNTISSRSQFDFKTTTLTTDKILTLSTCYNEDDKVVMHAKLIKISLK